MELIAEISDKTLGFRPIKDVKYSVRKSSRAVILNKNKEVALIHSTKYNFYKLPGGGIEGSEGIEKAAEREAADETGYKIAIDKPLGTVIEYKDQKEAIQVSYCFLSHPVGKPKKLKLTESEKAKGQELSWVKGLNTAIKLVKSNKSDVYEAKYMVKRDSLILEKARDIIAHKG